MLRHIVPDLMLRHIVPEMIEDVRARIVLSDVEVVRRSRHHNDRRK